MTRRTTLLAIILCLFHPVWADLTVQIEAPTLLPGMEALEAMIAAEADSFSANIESMISEMLAKPLFMRGFTMAADTAGILAGGSMPDGALSVELGSLASAWAASWTPETLEFLAAIGPDDDMAAGACVEPLVFRLALPLERVFKALPRGFDAGLELGFMDANGATYGVRSLSAGLEAGFSAFGGTGTIVRWNGMRFGLGANYANNTVRVTVVPGRIYQTVPIDPDGNGPLAPLQASLSVDPTVHAGVSTGVFTAIARVATGVTLFRAFTFSAGAGFSVGAGSSGISIDSDSEVDVEGYLANLVEENGRIIIGGRTDAVSITAYGGFLSLGLRFSVGAFALSAPLVWNVPSVAGDSGATSLPGGFGAGVFLGVAF